MFTSKKFLIKYNTRIESSSIKNPYDIWKYIKKSRAGNGMPNEITFNETISTNKTKL